MLTVRASAVGLLMISIAFLGALGTPNASIAGGAAPDVVITTKGQWIGGTGRFKNAAGTYTCSGKVVPPKGPSYTCEGVIRY